MLPSPCPYSLLILGCLWQTLGPERKRLQPKLGIPVVYHRSSTGQMGGQPHTHTSRTKHCSAERQLTKHSFVNHVCSCDPLESLLIRGTKDQSYKPYRLTDPGALTSEVGSEGKGVGSGEEEDWEGRVGTGEV